MHTLIEERRDKIAGLCRQHHVRRLAAFGSVLRPDFDAQRSDIDFLVEFEPLPPSQYANNYFELLDSLSRLLMRSVDLVVWKSIKNPYFLHEVEASQELLYAA